MNLDACSFKECREIICGNSRGVPELKKVSECQDTITSHLASCHLSRSGLTEANVILARAGHFDLTENQVDKMMICPHHRHNLERYWRPPRSCQYPTHNGPQKKQCNDRHAIGVATAKEIQSVCKVTVGIVHLFLTLCDETPGKSGSSSVHGSAFNHLALSFIICLCFDLHFPHIAIQK